MTCTLQRQNHNEDSSWRCDNVHVVSAEVMVRRSGSLWQRPAKQQWQWTGKSGSLPSILQRQRDVKGRWPFPANQREIRGEERTPPSTAAQGVMRFPCLCWLAAVWRYLYYFWQKIGIYTQTYLLALNGKEELESFMSQVCLSSPTFWVNFLSVGDVWLV